MHAKNRIDYMLICVFRFLIASQAVCPLRCVFAYDNLETACRPMKTDLKVGFLAAIRNATDATHGKLPVIFW